MRVEILETLKGSSLWRRGTVFDDAVAPIPGDILKEVDNGSRIVRAMAENPFAMTESEKETVDETSFTFSWGKTPDVEEPPLDVPEIDYLSELEWLVEQSKPKIVAEKLGVPHQRMTLWRSGKKTPPEDAIKLIHEEFIKVHDGQE